MRLWRLGCRKNFSKANSSEIKHKLSLDKSELLNFLIELYHKFKIVEHYYPLLFI